jgi:hypothetical protein
MFTCIYLMKALKIICKTKYIIDLELNNFVLFLNLLKIIKLSSLRLTICEQDNEVNYDFFYSKLIQQTSLEMLSIKHIPGCLLTAISKLHNLKYWYLELYPDDCKDDNKSCLKLFYNSLWNMQNLMTLIVSPNDNIE